jgi:ABC-type glycerol-3-phosphate transport system substrate-binding protein
VDLDKQRDQLVDAYHDGALSRRDFIGGALRLGLSASAAGALLASCGKSSSKSSSTTVAKKLSGRVQVLVGFGTGNSPAQVPVQEALAQAFTTANPDVHIEFVRVPTGSSDARTKLTTLIGGGTAPQIVMPAGLYGISLFVDQDVWLDLSPYFDRDGLSLDRFLPETTTATHVPNYFGNNAKEIVGVPIGVHDHVLAYNADLFSKAGVGAPPTSRSDTSWTLQGKFLDAAKALTVGTTQFGVGHFFRETVFYAFGGHMYDAASRKAQFDKKASIDGIQFAADLVNRQKVQPSQTQVATLGAGAEKGNEEQLAWRNGKLAMIDMCSCDIKSPYGQNVPFTWKAAVMPAGPARRFSFLNLDVGAIVKPSSDHDLAWEVLKFFTVDPANEKQLAYGSYGAMPPLQDNTDAFGQGIRQDLPNVDPSVWVDSLPDASPENEAWFPAFAQVNDLVGKAFDDVVGGMAASDVMPKLQQDAQVQIDNWFKTHQLPHG